MKIHTGEKYTCQCHHCGKDSAVSLELDGHVIIHTGDEFAFKCNQCGKNSAHSFDLDDHVKIYTGDKENAF